MIPLPLKTKVTVDGNKKGTITGIFADHYSVKFNEVAENEPPVRIVHMSTVKEDPDIPIDQLFVVDVKMSFVINIDYFSKFKEVEVDECVKEALTELVNNNLYTYIVHKVGNTIQLPIDWTGNEIPFSLNEFETRTVNEIFSK